MNLKYNLKFKMDKKQEEVKDISQTLMPMQILDKTYSRPLFNRNFLRMYGHYLCPYVERVRLALNAKNLPY